MLWIATSKVFDIMTTSTAHKPSQRIKTKGHNHESTRRAKPA